MDSNICIRCSKVSDFVYDKMCEECYDDEYSGCYGGGCVGGDEENVTRHCSGYIIEGA